MTSATAAGAAVARRGWWAGLAGVLGATMGGPASIAARMFRVLGRAWSSIPRALPSWWLAHGLTGHPGGKVAFLLSNVPYLAAGLQLLLVSNSVTLGTLMLGICGVSSAYHAAQCFHGCESAEAARWCIIDTAVALSSSFYFMCVAGGVSMNAAIAGALSAAFFTDSFGLGYTLSHSLWHFSTAAAALLVVRKA